MQKFFDSETMSSGRGRGGPLPPGGENFLSPNFLKEKISKSYNGVKTPNMQKIFDSETMSSGGGRAPPLPPGGENFLSPNFLKEKISKSYNGVKTPNMQNFFDSETMSSGGGRGGAPRRRKFSKSKFPYGKNFKVLQWR